MDGCPLGLGLVVEDEPTEFSCILHVCICVCAVVPYGEPKCPFLGGNLVPFPCVWTQ